MQVAPDECFFWVNDENELCIAMREASPCFVGETRRREFVLSLVLGEPPAGAARHYRLTRQSARMKDRKGFCYTRAASLSGEAIVWDYGPRRLRGRFRMVAKHQTYSVLTGWRGNSRAIIVGEFVARRNDEACRDILARTETGGMERKAERGKPVPVYGPPRPGQKPSAKPSPPH
ncbi:MAG: hypothetical protein PVI86_08355 [Phycisphaerae bacterium]|jgi:hypothetical protein